MQKEGYTLIFEDDFNVTDLDGKKWLAQYFPHGTSKLKGCLTKYEIEDGCLKLVIDETTPTYAEDSDMKVSSLQTFEKDLLHIGAGLTNVRPVKPYHGFSTTYGYFEMRAKLPSCGGGGHMAWWLIGTQEDAKEDGSQSLQTAEIDIVETLFADNNLFRPSLHAWTDPKLEEYHEEINLEGEFNNSYHIYGLDWSPKGLIFYVDGEAVARTYQSPDYPMCMFLGLYTNCDWSGRDNEVYPKEFVVDYIRVYKPVD